MSELMARVLRAGPPDPLLLVVLAAVVRGGNSGPTFGKVVARLPFSERTVRRAVNVLVASGFLVVSVDDKGRDVLRVVEAALDAELVRRAVVKADRAAKLAAKAGVSDEP